MLIEIEGVRGAGKSTLIAGLCAGTGTPDWRFVSAAATEEELAGPGWSLGAFMRGLDEPVPAPESLFLYGARTAARARLISALRAPGTVVLSDRLSLSLYVQARLAGLANPDAWALVRLALQDAVPACTVLLDADYQTHLQRLKDEGREPQSEPDFQTHRAAFAQAFQTTTATRVRVDTTSMAADQVRGSVLAALPLSREPGCGVSS